MGDGVVSKQIKVCFVMPKAYPLFNPNAEGVFGGAEVDLYLLAGELSKDVGFKVDFVTADYGQADIEQIGNVRVIKSLDFDRSMVSGAMRIWKALKRSDADIYIVKTASPGAALIAFFCKLHNRSFVYRSASSRETDGQYIKANFFLGRAFKYALRNAKAVLVQNDIDKTSLESSVGIDSIVIPNGHDLSMTPSQSRQFILWVGRSDDVKKPGKFLTLAEQFPQEIFMMICQPATGDNNYESLCQRAESINNLIFHRKVSFNEIDKFFEHAKVLVNTSDSEGFPNTFIQACKNATAILTLNVNPDGFLDEYGCGVCCKGDEATLATELKQLLLEDGFLRMGRNGRKYVEEKHDIAKIIDRYKTIFLELVEQGNNAGS